MVVNTLLWFEIVLFHESAIMVMWQKKVEVCDTTWNVQNCVGLSIYLMSKIDYL